MRRGLGALITLVALAAVAAPASAKTFTAEQGGVKATVDYGKMKANRLTIVRNGATLFDAAPSMEACGAQACPPSGFSGDPPLRVLDLDADGEPEVVYSAYTGGAHCCSVVLVYRLAPGGGSYTSIEHNFGDPGFRIADLNSDGRPDWLTGDDRFAYRYTAYAFSALPVLILRYSPTGFADVTKQFPGRVKRDRDQLWRRYRSVRSRRDGTELGLAAAWAADMYRLGKRSTALRVLRAEVRHHRLRGPGRIQGKRFVSNLDRFLRHSGY